MSYREWHVGMKVVCIRNSVRHVNYRGLPGFKKGEILTIEGFHWNDNYGMFLSFIERDRLNWGHVHGFRPLRNSKTDISIFTSMLTGSKQKEPV